MSFARSFNRSMAIAIAAGISLTGVAVSGDSSFSSVPSAHAQVVSEEGQSIDNFAYADDVLPIHAGASAYAVVTDMNLIPFGLDYTHNAPEGWDLRFDETSHFLGSVIIDVPEGTPEGETTITVTATNPENGDSASDSFTVEVLDSSNINVATAPNWNGNFTDFRNSLYEQYKDTSNYYFLESVNSESPQLSSTPNLGDSEEQDRVDSFMEENGYYDFGYTDDVVLYGREEPGKYHTTLVVTDRDLNVVGEHDFVYYLTPNQSYYHFVNNYWDTSGNNSSQDPIDLNKDYRPYDSVASSQATNGLPEGTRISSDRLPDWIEIDEENAALNSELPRGDVYDGYYTFPLTFSFPDGTSKDIDFDYFWSNKGLYSDGSGQDRSRIKVDPGEEINLTPVLAHDIPDTARFYFEEGIEVPDWLHLDESTGVLTGTVPEDIVSGTTIFFDHRVITMDWDQEDNAHSDFFNRKLSDRIDMSDTQFELFLSVNSFFPDVIFDGDVTVTPGEEISIDSPTRDDAGDEELNNAWEQVMTEHTTYQGGENNPEWITVESDGSITGTVPSGIEPGEYPYNVLITTEALGTEDTVTGTITVEALEDTDGDGSGDTGTEDNDPGAGEDTNGDGSGDTGTEDNDPGAGEDTGDTGTEDNDPVDTDRDETGGTDTDGNGSGDTGTEDTDTDTDTDGNGSGDTGTEDNDPVDTDTDTDNDTDNDRDDQGNNSNTNNPVTPNPNNGDRGGNSVNDDTEYDKDPTDYGPKVKTGGNVNKVTLWDQIKGFFR